MAPRLLALCAVSFLLVASTAQSADKKKPSSKKATSKPVRTWKAVVDHAWKIGTEWPLKAPSTRTLGFDADEIKAKGVSLDDDKSKDGMEHAFRVIYEIDEKGNPQPKELSLGTTLVKEKPEGKEIDGYKMLVSLDGTLIRGMRANGLVGHVQQIALPSDSLELKKAFEAEKRFYLKEVDLAALTP
ncbi:MAG: hypothetical protein M0D55_13975 [Elusimicrobiota bacterium]|nr:MAG: hypothetical protein M0D55_13975 [Elusimicrobiota bacterium]